MNRTIILLLLMTLFLVGCNGGSSSNDGIQWPIHEYREIPFTDFKTEHHDIALEFLAEKLQARLTVDSIARLQFPENILPLKVLELTSGRLVVITRALFSGNLAMFVIDADGTNRLEIPFPPSLVYSLFKQAIVYKNELLIILYDVQNLENEFYRLEISNAGIPTFDVTHYDHLQFNGRYEVDANIFMTEYEGKLYFVAEGVCYVYANDNGTTSLSRHALTGSLSVVEISAFPQGIAGLFQNEDLNTTPFIESGQKSFILVDLQTFNEIVPEQTYGIPYNLRYENGWRLSEVTGPDDLRKMLEYDLGHKYPSGIFDLGGNNLEGRVAWSQVYYLNGFIDLVKTWESRNVDFGFLGGLQDKMKLRLDLEMYLLDRLLDQENPGMISRRYSIDRAPVIHAVQTGRTLRLLKRYRMETDNPLHLSNYEKFLDSTRNLEGHIEVLVQAGSANNYPETIPGQYFLIWPKGSAFWADGCAIPYNHQNDWAGGVAYGVPAAERDSLYLRAARDIVSIFLTNEQFYGSPPMDYQWRYNWGLAWQGWDTSDGISVNTPEYSGDHHMAHISYRVIDVMAVLSVGQVYPELLPGGFVSYVQGAVEKNGVYPFASEELIRYGVYPSLDPDLAALYVRVKSPWELQNSAWAILSLYHRMN